MAAPSAVWYADKRTVFIRAGAELEHCPRTVRPRCGTVAGMEPRGWRHRGLLVDFMGVLTTDLFNAYRAFCLSENRPAEAILDLLVRDPEGHKLLMDVERGWIAQREFEAAVGARLGVDGERLVERVWRHLRPQPQLLEFIRRARAAGVKTGLLSNSLGTEPYNASAVWGLGDYFDTMVVSGEVGLRKPDPEIFELAVKRLGVPAEATVFVDDMDHNLEPARAVGLIVVHHTDADRTVTELERLFADALSPAGDSVPSRWTP
jgi:putative hydrolase of the HAD superfamily